MTMTGFPPTTSFPFVLFHEEKYCLATWNYLKITWQLVAISWLESQWVKGQVTNLHKDKSTMKKIEKGIVIEKIFMHAPT